MFGTLTILIIILAIVITSQNISKKDKNESEKSVLNTSTTQPPTISSMPTSSPFPTDMPTLTPSPTPTPTTFIPTPQPTNDNQLHVNFKYPNSIIISQNASETIYESTDDPKKITDWYKDKIKSMNMNVTSFVQTNTNGNILNKLVGSNGNEEVRIEITKQNNSQIVKISFFV